MDQVHRKLTDSGLYQRFDRGLCSPECFREEIRAACGIALTDEQINEAWNALLLDFPSERVALIHRISANYRLYLLSNTNSIHFDSYVSAFRARHDEDFIDLFTSLFLSFEMGLHKPDPEIYRRVLQEGEMIPSETLFIDDAFVNVQAAAAAGMKAFHLSPDIEVINLFKGGWLKPDIRML
jgi:putative hydrolase of the HAD superfamily